jgi:sodium transport system permease protein
MNLPDTSGLFAVLQKELRDALRDRRALLMVGLFVLIYPLVMAASLHRMIEREARADREEIEVGVIGAEAVPTLVQQLGERGITVRPLDDAGEAAIATRLAERQLTAVIRVPDTFAPRYLQLRPAPLELWHDSVAGQAAKLRRVEEVLRGYRSDIAQARLLAHGVSPVVSNPIDLRQYDVASRASRSGKLLGAIFGVFFVATFYFCMSLAIDATAGERERRSLELLLAQPVPPFAVIAGKWLAGAALCAVGLGLELAFGHALLSALPLEQIGMSWRLGLPGLTLIWLAALPLCLFAAAFEIALALNSKSFKEAQTAVGFALLLPLIPVIVVPMLDLDTRPWMYAVPVLAEQTLLLGLARGEALPWTAFATAAGVSLAAAAGALWLATRRIASERFVLGI